MSGAEIILLVGVVGVWVLIAGVAAAGIQMRRTLRELEKTLEDVREELSEVSPRLQALLDESGRTAAELTSTIGHVGKRIARLGSSDRGNAMMYLKLVPVALGLVRGILPLIRRRRNRE
ncbi:hypothetical protein JW921_02105 [Candidatus Fermentibacterales bacterium]|nr:hypothetical protein [Candidatus Fermentibacterales bacterium]